MMFDQTKTNFSYNERKSIWIYLKNKSFLGAFVRELKLSIYFVYVEIAINFWNS